MPKAKRIIRKLTNYLPTAEIFQRLPREEFPFFLDSSLINNLGRYSIIAGKAYLTLEKYHDKFYINHQEENAISFEDYLRNYLDSHRESNSTDLPILSGAIGYFSYEYGRKLMEISSHKRDLTTIPDAMLSFFDLFIIEDCPKKEIYLIANGITTSAQELLNQAEKYIYGMAYSGNTQIHSTVSQQRPLDVFAHYEKEDYENAVQSIINYIIEGDIYIANMTQQLIIRSDKNPEDVFYHLRDNNPSPFGGYLDLGDFQIICASPERFLKLENNQVETRPIKGTRKRGDNQETDNLMRQELVNSEKDKSELLMIVDLERNDLNRVCRAGTVKVTELFQIEEYATVFHMVSTIQGELISGKNFVDILEAGFPGGSITGAPKYRAMEIIDEIEPCRRNIYTGSLGYLSLDGSCDFNIIIRTALHKEEKYYLGVGGGITAESEPDFEYEETLQKAKAVLEALK